MDNCFLLLTILLYAFNGYLLIPYMCESNNFLFKTLFMLNQVVEIKTLSMMKIRIMIENYKSFERINFEININKIETKMSSHADDNRNACSVSRNTLNTFDEDCVVLTICGDICNELPLQYMPIWV